MPRGRPPKSKRGKVSIADLDIKLSKKDRESKLNKLKYEQRKEENKNKLSEENALTSDEADDKTIQYTVKKVILYSPN